MNISTDTKRRVRTLGWIVVILMTISWIVTVTVAHAATYTPGCKSYVKNWYMQEAAVSLRIFTVQEVGTACWNSSGALTSTNLSTYMWLTNPGSVAGWHVQQIGSPYQSSWGNLSVWVANGTAWNCVPWMPWACTYKENFATTMRFIAPVASYTNAVIFQPNIYCTNSVCKLRANSTP